MKQELRIYLVKFRRTESLERRYVARAWACFGNWLRRVRVQLPQTLGPDMEERLETHLTQEEALAVL